MLKRHVLFCLITGTLLVSQGQARAQGGESVANGAIIGAAVGAGVGVAFTHAVRDSDLTFGQYARSALIFGAIGAGAGIGVDALFNRSHGQPPQARRPLLIAPGIWRNVAGVVVKWRW
jgi:drug/metabolite transporter (DMT)-like permease